MSNTVETESIEMLVKQFRELDQKISHINSILGLLSWDKDVMAPKKGRSIFANAIGTLSTENFKLTVSEEMGSLLEELSKPEVNATLDEVTKAIVRERKRDYDKSKSIPAELYNEFVVLTNNAGVAWAEAREKNDFSIYQPFLEKIVAMRKQFAEIVGYEGHPYNALLDDFEPGLTVDTLTPLFAQLREKSIELLNRIQASPHQPRKDIFSREFDVEKQKAFNRFLLPKLGFDMDGGRLDETVHPFAQNVNTGDVRITTRYLKDNVRSAIFGTIHEAGHGMYEQNVNPEFNGTGIVGGTSFGIHESQSRFFENTVGRSREFWTHFYGDLKEHFPTELADVELDEFYRAINAVEPSYIRVEADELTYNLHIMLRFEIEKALMAGEIEVKDLPKVWNEKMEEYLGITPPTDTLGVLQDVHWSFGGLGYFPSYSLGNLYAAQLFYKIKEEMPEFDTVIENGEVPKIKDWMKEKIHQHGKFYTPGELIVRVTGEELNADYLVKYLEEKYSEVYKLN